MKILCFSNNEKQNQDIGWHRVGENINYHGNHFKRECAGLSRYARNFFTLTFTIEFQHDDDQ
jgi:hypothetical protein